MSVMLLKETIEQTDSDSTLKNAEVKLGVSRNLREHDQNQKKF